ncbi:MAG: PAS domain S-box protein [Acidobacteria bacterium]|nr:MAG: PAS domain S-box protein [Acidobacteriota bacterium]
MTPADPLRLFARLLRHDRWCQGMLVLWGAGWVLAVAGRAVSGPAVSGHPIAVLAAALAAAALWRQAWARRQRREICLWRPLAASISAWTLTLVLIAAGAQGAWGEVLRSSLLAVSFVALALAAERQPWRPLTPGAWPASSALVLGLLSYFVWLPAALGEGEATGSWLGSPVYALFAVYLSGRFLFAARAAPSPVMRAIYALLAAASAAFLADLLLRHLAPSPPAWAVVLGEGLSYLPAAAVLLAARLRAAVPGPRPATPVQQQDATILPQGQAMAAALILALVHFGWCAFGGSETAELRDARELLVLGWLVLFGTVALLQRRWLEGRARALERDRRQIESSLRASEQDLRVIIERRSAREALSASEEKFARAFRFSPDAIAISTAEDGRFVEVNPAFERLLGYRRGAILGRTSSELGIWFDPEDRAQIVRAVEEHGSVRDLKLPYRNKAGERRIALFSAQPIKIAGERCLIIVGHDVTEMEHAEQTLREQALLLDQARDAICVLDLDARLRYWNPSAEELCGWSRDEVLGRPVEHLLAGDGSERYAEVRQALRQRGAWRGVLHLTTRSGERLAVDSRFTLIRDEAGHESSVLVLSRPLTA